VNELHVVTLADRRAVAALLDRMLDWLPPARLSVARDETSKPGVGTWQGCPVCASTGRVVAGKACRQPHTRWPFGHGCVPCQACTDGYRLERPGRGMAPSGTDRMLNPGKHDLDTDAQRKAEQRRYLDAQLVKLAALERQRAGVEAPDDDLTRAVAAKAHLYSTGSFARLEVALLQLAIAAPLRHEAVRLYLIEHQAVPSPPARERLDSAVGWLAARMPRPILLPGDAVNEVEAWKRSLEAGRTPEHRRQREARDREIVDLVDEHGWTLRRVAALYALSPEGVRKIVGRVERHGVASGPVAA
jgi:hypothetical protein